MDVRLSNGEGGVMAAYRDSIDDGPRFPIHHFFIILFMEYCLTMTN